MLYYFRTPNEVQARVKTQAEVAEFLGSRGISGGAIFDFLMMPDTDHFLRIGDVEISVMPPQVPVKVFKEMCDDPDSPFWTLVPDHDLLVTNVGAVTVYTIFLEDENAPLRQVLDDRYVSKDVDLVSFWEIRGELIWNSHVR